MNQLKNEYVNKIYLASVLLEKNRHKPPKHPSFKVSEWIDSALKAGFDGMEIWGNHVLKAEEEEKADLKKSSRSLKIFSAYCRFENDFEEERQAVAEAVKALGIKRIKYNIGKDPALEEVYRKNLIEWSGLFPEDVEFLCECHAGTIIESPEKAAEFFSGFPEERFAMITHPFGKNRADMDKWFQCNGSRLRHLHIQYRDGDNKTRSLRTAGDVAEQVFAALKDYGYKGSYSLEFTEGMNEPEEEINSMFSRAVSDLQFLKESLP